MKDFILKELDLIDNTISRLDSQIQTSKNICITLWTAWLGWFVTQTQNPESSLSFGYIIIASALFPILFWGIDYQYRKALLSTSKRQTLISLFINSKKEKELLEKNDTNSFPLLDPVGWLYTLDAQSLIENSLFKLNERKKNELLKENLYWTSVLFYKEAKWFYLPLIITSIILGAVILNFKLN